ncbi:ATP-dependent DNA helicase DinG [Paracidovorax anthurii]|uniref:ATP-dependent DNA helicase DinG n=1 Tax=Paracidovorax anthurii TaxID=78229 RepID=A0A328Z4M5_9BURK|nr:ATP-dependent DNA helicase DinG [Paracidovorax anthurii]RAR81008.1 ATP-dependent DNA helicase DinG [Paracidovorax anthurii]
MLSDDEKARMQSCLRTLREAMPGFASRRSQLIMMAEVAHALSALGDGKEGLADAAQRIAVIEAGTGTGKTLGYLLPAIVLARSRGLSVVVSSSTVALQEQLMTKDLPALQQYLPLAFSCALAKGRRRYACPAKLLRLDLQRPVAVLEAAASPGAVPPQAPSRPLRLEGRLAKAFEGGTWSGDRDDWCDPIPEGLWHRISTDSEGCLGPRCEEFGRCPFQAARQRVKEADVVVANHDLLLAALDMEPGLLLPDPARTLFVLDEAHGLPDKAAARGASRHAVLAAHRWVEDAALVADHAGRELRLDAPLAVAVGKQGRRLCGALEELHGALSRRYPAHGPSPIHRFAHGALPSDIHGAGASLHAWATALRDALGALRDAALGRARQDAVAAQPHVAALGACLGSIEHLTATWECMLRPAAEGDPPTARWIEGHGKGGRAAEYHVCAAPISGGHRLRALLWERAGAAVLTSATLQACGSFDLFMEESGLKAWEGVRAISLPSPFDHAAQAELHLPRMRSHPRDAESHTEEVAAMLPALLEVPWGTPSGALVLFASARQMQQVEQALPPPLREQILMQGRVSRREMLAHHRKRIDQGLRSILFGLASLSEGVDLPGAYCTHLVVAKLPFAVPDDPVEQTRREWIEAQGRSAFLERSVPEVGIRLAQAVGRLLRTPEDRGRVTVLDPRLAGTPWGRRLLAGLPPFRRVQGAASGGPSAAAPCGRAA